MGGEVPQHHQDTIPDDYEEELTDERNMTVPSNVVEVVQSQQQTTDMFFSCCDWEDAREAEKHQCPLAQANETSIGENFSSDDEEDLEKVNIQVPQSSNKMCKRKTKLARKASVGELPAVEIQKSEHIDIDSVIKKVASVQDTERIVSFKKYFSNRKAQRSSKLT